MHKKGYFNMVYKVLGYMFKELYQRLKENEKVFQPILDLSIQRTVLDLLSYFCGFKNYSKTEKFSMRKLHGFFYSDLQSMERLLGFQLKVTQPQLEEARDKIKAELSSKMEEHRQNFDQQKTLKIRCQRLVKIIFVRQMDKKIKEIVFDKKCKRRTSKIIIPSEETPNGLHLEAEQSMQRSQQEGEGSFPVSPNSDLQSIEDYIPLGSEFGDIREAEYLI